jgi:hypothetical protein
MRGVRTAVLAGLALLAAVGGGGCASIHDTRQVLGRAGLVNDLASRLDRANTMAYDAQYQLAGGKMASIAQALRPTRRAYIFPGGKVVINATETAECIGTRCTLTAPPLSTNGPPASVLDAGANEGMVHPTVAIGLLTDAALDRDAVIDQSDSTIAGQHATCVDVSHVEATPPFKACITSEGVLGSFAGTLRGKPVEVALISYARTVPDSSFQLPPGAVITDQRQR